MARPKKTVEGEVEVEILRDGVFAFEDVRFDTGDRVSVPHSVAEELRANGLAK